MKKTMIRFLANFFATDASGNSSPRFKAGNEYDPANDLDGEMKRGIARGIAEEVEVDVPDETALSDGAVAGIDAAAASMEAAATDVKPAKAKK